MDRQTEDYLLSLLNTKPEWMTQLETLARNERVPIMEPLGIEYIRQLIRLQKPRKILEIGTAIGYSSLMMADAYLQSEIITIERDELRYNQALRHIDQMNKQDQIKVIFGDALEVQTEVEKDGPYDLLFIDAAKGQYRRFFEIYAPLVPPGGIVVTDNVLFRGLVSGSKVEENKRLSNVASKVRSFNEWLTGHKEFHTTIMPIGDGVAVSIRK